MRLSVLGEFKSQEYGILTLQEYVFPLCSFANPNCPSSAEKPVSITAPAAEHTRMPFLGSGDFRVMVKLKTSVPVVGVTVQEAIRHPQRPDETAQTNPYQN